MSEITVKQLQEKVDEWHLKRKQIDEIKDVLEEKNKELNKLQFELFEMMEALEIHKFEGTLGKVQVFEIPYVNMPQDDKKQEFFNFLKDQGEFEDMATVHHGKLNSWFKSKLEEDPLFVAPGLDEPKIRKELRKGR